MKQITQVKGNSFFNIAELLLAWFMAITAIVLWLAVIWVTIKVNSAESGSFAQSLVLFMRRACYFVISCTALWVLLKGRKQNTVIHFVFTISLIAVENAYALMKKDPQISKLIPIDLTPFFGVLIAIAFVRLSQQWPLRLQPIHIRETFAAKKKFKPVAGVLTWLLRPAKTWFLFIIIFLVIKFLLPDSVGVLNTLLFIGISILYWLVQNQYSQAQKDQQLYWWLWMVLIHFLLYFFFLFLNIFNIQIPKDVSYIISSLVYFSFAFGVIMSVFFTELFDSRLLLKRTAIYAFILIVLAFVFGVLEHFVIHNLAHWLHMSDAFITSLFAGAAGLVFHPLKKRLDKLIKKIFPVKKNKA